jgi:hypothetical protein
MDWDRADSWEVRRVHETRMRVVVRVSNALELARVRELLPELRDVPPAALRTRISDAVLELGEFGSIEGPRVVARARDLGLQVDTEKHSTVRHVCFNRTRSHAVEDPHVADEMLAAGVPLVHVEID